MSELVNGLEPNGKPVVIGATFDPIEDTAIQRISGSRSIQGWAAGTPADSDGIFCALPNLPPTTP